MAGKSRGGAERNFKHSLPLELKSLGQSCPHHCPEHCPQEDGSAEYSLGEPLSIREVAKLIGVSSWTIRQRYLSAGIPHFRSGRVGKLIFYKNQIIEWLLVEQQKGGTAA